MSPEIWKPVVNFETSYEVSNRGRVRSLPRSWNQTSRKGLLHLHIVKGKILSPGLASNGYFTVAIGRRNSRTIHSLVAETFLGPCPSGMEVRHKDGNRQRSVLENLEYGTRAENNIDASKHNRRKLKLKFIKKIRSFKTLNCKQAKGLANLGGCSTSQVFNIFTRRQWAHI